MFKYRLYPGVRGYWSIVAIRVCLFVAPRLPRLLRQCVLNDAWGHVRLKREQAGLSTMIFECDGALDMLLAYKE